MRYSDELLTAIYDRTSGYCHICRKKLAFRNYAIPGARAAWHVDHSNPEARGGSGRLGNLYAACIACNCSKGACTTRSARTQHGHSRAPVSRERRAAARQTAALVVGGAGAFLGHKVAQALGWHPGLGVVAGGLLGADLGGRHNPDRGRR